MNPWLVLAVSVLPACAGPMKNPAQVTPQRPTVSSDTSTTMAGTLELEVGAIVDPRDALDTPMVAKWGADRHTELFLGWSPYQFASRPGPDAMGAGDTAVGVRHRFREESDAAPSAAVQFATKLPSGNQSDGLSSGEIDFFLAGVMTKSYGTVTGTAYYQAGLLGDAGGGDANLTHTLAAAAGLPIGRQFGVVGELAAILDPESDSEIGLATFGSTFEISRSLVLDAGVVIGLSRDAPDFQVFVGFTKNLGGMPTPSDRD